MTLTVYYPRYSLANSSKTKIKAQLRTKLMLSTWRCSRFYTLPANLVLKRRLCTASFKVVALRHMNRFRAETKTLSLSSTNCAHLSHTISLSLLSSQAQLPKGSTVRKRPKTCLTKTILRTFVNNSGLRMFMVLNPVLITTYGLIKSLK